MDDRYEDLENIFNSKIDEVKKSDYGQLLEICNKENLDCDGMSEQEIRDALIEYFNEEIE